jgi:hypothetical protein
MYAVVGCSDCEALWVVEGRPETTGCPRCRTRHQFDRLKQFVTTEAESEARTARAAMLAQRADSDLDAAAFAAMAEDAEAAGMDPAEYLAAAGLDPDAVAAAGERATESPASPNREEAVRAALDALDDPDRAAVVAYAADHGVSEDAAGDVLDRLRRAGEVTESGGRYRLL